MGKITTEMCREMFEEFDYKLVDEYKGSDIKMKTICPNFEYDKIEEILSQLIK